MFRDRRAKRSRGQALVEFTLAATLIFTLLSAAVDLGLIFFTLQGLRVAAQEGATYGSHPVFKMNGNMIESVDLPYDEIVKRVRLSNGVRLDGSGNPTGLANLIDLNNDGTPDDLQSGVIDNYTDPNSYIYIENLRYKDDNLTKTPTTCTTDLPNQGMRKAAEFCYVRVTVSYEYRFIFPLAPVFGDTVRLRTSFLMRVRSSFIG